MAIDWTDPKSHVSKHFTVKECIWLPQWNRLANASDGLDDTVKGNLIKLCTTMDKVRELIDRPFNVHCMYRPEAYNKLVGGAVKSAHKFGRGIDFHISRCSCDDGRAILEKHLEKFGLRMEKNPGSNWIHLDDMEVLPGKNRYFNV